MLPERHGRGREQRFFRPGDANALPFADGTFDAVVSKDVYHNISGKNKQALLLESLRVLKKGGTFAIHDLMSPMRYGDMNAFRQKLLDMGYEKVDLFDTTKLFFRFPRRGPPSWPERVYIAPWKKRMKSFGGAGSFRSRRVFQILL